MKPSERILAAFISEAYRSPATPHSLVGAQEEEFKEICTILDEFDIRLTNLESDKK